MGEESERENGGVCLLGISKLTVICWSLRSRAELRRIYFQILIHQMRITDEAVRKKKKTGPDLPVGFSTLGRHFYILDIARD